MKTILTRSTIAAVFTTALVFAQGPGPRGGTPPDPQTMIARRVDGLTKVLSLTDDQKARAATIFTNVISAEQSSRTSLRTTSQSISDAVKRNDTAAIDQLSVTLGTLTGQLTASQRKADAAFYALLTPDQQTKFDAMPQGGPGGGFGGPQGMGRFNRRPPNQ